jgi:hypothetical protein
MTKETVDKILTNLLNKAFDSQISYYKGKQIEKKELIEVINNLRVEIYSRDHNPPHFHITSNDNVINAKFLIKDCSLYEGSIGRKDKKKVEEWYNHIKTQLILQQVWDKRL